ncbi:MAG: aspartate carbamoyltransferase catalytic subunit [Selenomonadaceae bacterium]|nr:aspartate carbamoyltransferase catalytic subunit [Selenomonadaceae bacterium]MBR6711085.1 aspartate carbamoyltransferase catalytic subunit [Selenomonadaceae bacterium]MBR6905632.1 aspartate carbamoyltransferase catalytic subunit [Selenomonadaceae bacterium]
MGKNNMSLRGRNVLGLEDFSKEEIRLVLETAKEMKNIIHRDIKKVPALRGKSIVNLFYEPSTRTRTSFELAGKYLGADVVNITASTSSIVKGESLRDTLYTVEAMGVDAIVMRHKAEGAAAYASRVVAPVIVNAGDGAHAHPSQGLLDLFTIEQHKGHLEGLKVAILGDILHSRVARSDIQGMRKMGMEVHLAGPKTLLPRFLFQEPGIFVHERIEEAMEAADVINVLRIQLERQKAGLFPSMREYARVFGVNEKRLSLAKKDVLVLHPGPMNKGLEIAPDVAYGDHSAIQEQVQNGVAIRMAILTLILTGGRKDAVD